MLSIEFILPSVLLDPFLTASIPLPNVSLTYTPHSRVLSLSIKNMSDILLVNLSAQAKPNKKAPARNEQMPLII